VKNKPLRRVGRPRWFPPRLQYVLGIVAVLCAILPGESTGMRALVLLAAAIVFATTDFSPGTVWLPAWFSTRFFYAAGIVALVAACAPGLAMLWPIAIAAFIALSIATAADFLAGPRGDAVSFTREAPDHLALRVTAELPYAVENRSGRAIRVALIETPVRTLRFVDDEAIDDVPARSRATLARAILPVSRGADEFGKLYAWYESRVGLVRHYRVADAVQPFRVFPDLSAVERYGTLNVRNKLIEAGLRKMRLRGSGTEFESLREWAAGDAFRTIDWKATARRGKMMVAQHEVERSQNVMLVLDCGRLMTPRIDEQRKFDYAVTAALSLATVAGLASDRVGVVAFAGDIIAASAPRTTRSSIARLTDLLYDLEPRFEEANYSRAFAYLRTHLHKRSLIVFLTDVVDPLAQAALLSELGSLARRHLLACVFMNDAAVATTLAAEPHDVATAYATSVALGLDEERRTASAILARTGAIVIDVPARKLTTSLIDAYLRVKQRGSL
jgi:uncharacterized protein (DUF58 family)